MLVKTTNFVLVVAVAITVVGSAPNYFLGGIIDIQTYVIPGFPGEFPTGFGDKGLDGKVTTTKYGKVKPKEMSIDNDFKNQLRDMQNTIYQDRKGINVINPKTHLAKTVENDVIKKKGDASGYLEGKKDQNVISDVETGQGSAQSTAIGHGKGDAISYAGSGKHHDMNKVMAEFNDMFKGM